MIENCYENINKSLNIFPSGSPSMSTEPAISDDIQILDGVRTEGLPKRRPRFKREETLCFVKLVAKDKEILEGKKTSKNIKDINNRAKLWEDLQREFNSTCIYAPVGGRTIDELKKRWDNLKRDAKKDSSSRRKEQTKTGGGPIKIENIDETLALVSDIISGALEPVTSKYDSDSIAMARVLVRDDELKPESETKSELESELKSDPQSESKSDPISNIEEFAVIKPENCTTPKPETHRKRELLPISDRKSNIKKLRSSTETKEISVITEINRRADELHQAKLDLITTKKRMLEERHILLMQLLDSLNKNICDRAGITDHTIQHPHDADGMFHTFSDTLKNVNLFMDHDNVN